jgi:hypothetical protein
VGGESVGPVWGAGVGLRGEGMGGKEVVEVSHEIKGTLEQVSAGFGVRAAWLRRGGGVRVV